MCSCAVIKNVFVNFIGDGEDVEFNAQVADQFQFATGEHLAGRVVRRIHDDRFGLMVKSRPQFALIEESTRRPAWLADATSQTAAWLRERIASGP